MAIYLKLYTKMNDKQKVCAVLSVLLFGWMCHILVQELYNLLFTIKRDALVIPAWLHFALLLSIFGLFYYAYKQYAVAIRRRVLRLFFTIFSKKNLKFFCIELFKLLKRFICFIPYLLAGRDYLPTPESEMGFNYDMNESYSIDEENR